MKDAFRVVKHDGVVAFGRLVVAGFNFCTHRIFAQGNSVCLDNFITVAQVHLAFRLFYQNVVNV